MLRLRTLLLGPPNETRRAADFSPRGAAQAKACGSSRLVSLGALGATTCLLTTSVLNAADWTHYAGDCARSSIAPAGPKSLGGAVWSAGPSPGIEYVCRSTPVACGGRVFVNARYFVNNEHVGNRIIAYDSKSGDQRWSTDIDPDISIWDSLSSPAVDTRNETVILGTGCRVHALDVITGDILWQTELQREIVNASPAVSADLTRNGAPANRVFITDYDGFGTQAKLYALNVDPYHPADNPYQPGEPVWSGELAGASGATPAYADGLVYVADRSGYIYAFDGRDGGPPRWRTRVELSGYPQHTGFYGGVTVRNGYVYAAMYVFYGGQNSSAMFKLDADTGTVVWDVPCERSASVPIVTDEGRIYLSGGIDGFGSAVKVQAFQDLGKSVVLLWDTYKDSGGMLIVGGWTFQPAYADRRLYAGRPNPSQLFGPYVELYVLDTALTPADPGFVVAQHAGAGGSPAVADGWLYSLGSGGLLAFAGWKTGDMNCDGVVDFDDIDPFVLALGGQSGYTARFPNCNYFNADCDGDGDVDFDDIDPFVALLGG